MQALKVGKKSLQVNCFFLSPCALCVAVCPVPQTLWVWACDPHSANRKEQSLKRSPPVNASCIGGGVSHTWLNVVLVNIFMGLRFTSKRKRMHWTSYKIMTTGHWLKSSLKKPPHCTKEDTNDRKEVMEISSEGIPGLSVALVQAWSSVGPCVTCDARIWLCITRVVLIPPRTPCCSVTFVFPVVKCCLPTWLHKARSGSRWNSVGNKTVKVPFGIRCCMVLTSRVCDLISIRAGMWLQGSWAGVPFPQGH